MVLNYESVCLLLLKSSMFLFNVYVQGCKINIAEKKVNSVLQQKRDINSEIIPVNQALFVLAVHLSRLLFHFIYY